MAKAAATPTRSRKRHASGDGATTGEVSFDTPTSADKILDAAEIVVLRRGMGRLTLAAVAEEARMSKAGLLHHFPSMDALIRAVVARHVAAWHDEFVRAYRERADAGEPRPAVGVLMSHCLSGTDAWTDAERARNRVMVAALVHDERHVEPLRRVHREMDAMLSKDRLPVGIGEAIHLAVNGLWFQWIFGMGEVSSERLKSIRATISKLAEIDPPKSPSPRKGFAATVARDDSARASGVRAPKVISSLKAKSSIKSTRTQSQSRGHR